MAFSRKRLAIAAAGVALLVGAYALVGTLVAPRLIRNALVDRAAAAGLDLRIGAMHAQPFRLVLEASDAQLSTRDGKRLAQARRATVDLAAASLWQRNWIVQRGALEAPVLYALPVVQGSGGAPPSVVIREWAVTDGTLALVNLPRLEHLAIEGRESAFNASAALAGGGSVRTTGQLTLTPLAASGELHIANAALGGLWRELPPGELGGSLRYRYADGKLAMSAANAEATLRSGGKAKLTGELALPAMQGQLALEAQDVPLALAQRWLPAMHIGRGTVQAHGTVHLGAKPRYEGAATIRDASLDGPQGELIGWRSLATNNLQIEFEPFGAHADELIAEAPHANVVIGEHGELNITRAFAGGGNAQAQGKRPVISVDRLTIEQGRLDFTDHSLPTPFSTTVHDLGGAVSGLSTAADAPARIALEGRVGKYGEASVRGALEPVALATRTNVQARLQNLALADFTPYAVKFAGYRIESGSLSATLRYRVREGRLVGSNTLEFDRLKLGEKVESAGALDLPIDLAVALLTDSQGRINLAIPVTGDLRDPKFDLGGLMAKALRTTLTRVVSAPFRALASLVGRGGDRAQLNELYFAPGSAELTPPAEEKLAQVAQALAERPRVALSIRAGYDAKADLQGLKRTTLLRELARRAGYSAAAGASASAALDARDPKMRRAAERLYLARGGHLWDLVKLKPRDLLAALEEKTELPANAIQALAEQRAGAVRDALARSGVDAARIDTASPVAVAAQPDGVTTALQVKAG